MEELWKGRRLLRMILLLFFCIGIAAIHRKNTKKKSCEICIRVVAAGVGSGPRANRGTFHRQAN